MAKKKIAPSPTPKAGDAVNYVRPNADRSVVPAKVTFVHEGHDGRLLNVEVQTPDGPQQITNTPWRAWDLDDITGNSWHWPDLGGEEEPPAETQSRRKQNSLKEKPSEEKLTEAKPPETPTEPEKPSEPAT